MFDMIMSSYQGSNTHYNKYDYNYEENTKAMWTCASFYAAHREGKETETYMPQAFIVGILHLKHQNPLNKKSI